MTTEMILKSGKHKVSLNKNNFKALLGLLCVIYFLVITFLNGADVGSRVVLVLWSIIIGIALGLYIGEKQKKWVK